MPARGTKKTLQTKTKRPKAPAKKTKTQGRPKVRTVKKKTPAQAAVALPIIKDAHAKSVHTVNLKNPQKHRFQESSAPTTKVLPTALPKLRLTPRPRAVTSTTSQRGVNLLQSAIKDAPWFSRPSLNTDEPAEIHLSNEIEDIFAPPPHKKFLALTIPRDWYKQLAVFLVVLLIIVLPLQALTYYQDLQQTGDQALLATTEAIKSLQQGSQAVNAFNFDGAGAEFEQAKEHFVLAQQEISALHSLTTELLTIVSGQQQTVSAAQTLLSAGVDIADTGQLIAASLKQLIDTSSIQDYYRGLVTFQSALEHAQTQFAEAQKTINAINSESIPETQRPTFENVKRQLPRLKQGLENVTQVVDALLISLGHQQWQRYLLIFMNNNELRGSGGFMGSFALLDIDRGTIKNLEVPGGGTYDVQGQLQARVVSPEPLHLINPRWEFQDANWWPDFPSSAQKIEWFYEQTGGPSVNGVIALTATLMQRLLTILGPIDMPEYGKVITGENFIIEAQNYSQIEYDRQENKPKKLIADLTPKLLERIFSASAEQRQALFEVLKQSLNEKHLLVYFNHEEVQRVASAFGWDGALRETQGDYLSVVHSNIAGGKTDEVIDEHINHQVAIEDDGTLTATVILTRTHRGLPGENIFTGVQNNSYVRFYVPAGSTLLSASGFQKPPAELFEEPDETLIPDSDLMHIEIAKRRDEESGTDIYEAHGKTVFGNWLQLKPGETKKSSIQYRLPFRLNHREKNTLFYSLLAQKQPGSLGSQMVSSLLVPDSFKILAKFPPILVSNEAKVNFSAILTTDQFYGLTFIGE